MTADPATLYEAMTGFASLLEEAAAAVPWTKNDGTPVTACVTPVEPAVECDMLYVWPGPIQTIHDPRVGCIAQPRVDINYRIATCIGAGNPETCEWWNQDDRAENAVDRLWGIYAYLSASYLNGTLCDDLGGLSCEDVRFEALNPRESGDYAVWDGVLRVDLDVRDLGS